MAPEAKQYVKLPDEVGMVKSICLEPTTDSQRAILACTGNCATLISLANDTVITRIQHLPVPVPGIPNALIPSMQASLHSIFGFVLQLLSKCY